MLFLQYNLYILYRIKDIVPNLIRDNNDLENALMEDDNAINANLKITANKVVLNKRTKIESYHNNFRILIEEFNLKLSDFTEVRYLEVL